MFLFEPQRVWWHLWCHVLAHMEIKALRAKMYVAPKGAKIFCEKQIFSDSRYNFNLNFRAVRLSNFHVITWQENKCLRQLSLITPSSATKSSPSLSSPNQTNPTNAFFNIVSIAHKALLLYSNNLFNHNNHKIVIK